MDGRELGTLNALVTFAAENIPGGLNSREQEVARKVGRWTLDGIPVRQMCPYCREALPHDDVREPWLEYHLDNTLHRWSWRTRITLRRWRHGLRRR